MFVNNEDYEIEFWANEVVEITAKVEGIPKKDARLRFLECLSIYIGFYEIGLRPHVAVDKFWLGDKK
jgi:hypothetical protein